MNLSELLAELNQRGVALWAEADTLRFSAPKGAITPDLRTLMVQHKAALLAHLAQSAQPLPIQPVSRLQPIPLSFAQQRIWFLNELVPDNPVYNIFAGVHLIGAVDIAALTESFNRVVQRHETLRTTFIMTDDGPVQLIAPELILTLTRVDLRDLTPAQQEVRIQSVIEDEAQRPFNLSEGPLVRATLVHKGKTEYLLLFTIHHIISDQWSMGILIREVTTFYDAISRNQPVRLPDLPVQYADFACWQRAWLQKAVLETELNFWREQLKGIPVLELPTPYPRPAVQTFKGTTQSFWLSASLSQRLQAWSRKEGVTLFMTLLAAFKVLLYRYTGQEDIVVGTAVANRNQTALENLIGFFVNTLVLRTQTSGKMSFRSFLNQVQDNVSKVQTHQNLPFEQLVEALQPKRDLSHNPLFQVMFVLHNAPAPSLNLPDLTLKPLGLDVQKSNFDLSFFLTETAQGILGKVEYGTDLFSADFIAQLWQHYQNLLEAILADPSRSLAMLPLLTDIEQHNILETWNDTAVSYPQEHILHRLIERQVDKSAQEIALIFEGQQLTYQELNEKANQLGHYLRQKGIQPDALVGVYMERSLEMIIGLLGVLKAGGAYVPFDLATPPKRLQQMLTDARPAIILTTSSLVSQLPPCNHQQTICLDTDWSLVSQQAADNLSNLAVPDNLAYVIYTSGSTGKPKGVMCTHEGICNRLLWMQQTYQLTPADCLLQKTPYTFDVSLLEIFYPLTVGARLVIAKPEGHKDSAYLVNVIAKEKVTMIHFVPSMLGAFLEENLAGCESLKWTICIGEALPPALQESFFAHLDAELHNLYGPTETAVIVTAWNCQRDTSPPTVPIGFPAANVQIYLLDQYGHPVPTGVPGELYVAGIGLARGYLNRPGLTAEKFVPHPYKTGERLYRTGDLARYLANGNLEFLGRIDNQVKIRGFRIELGEIETALNKHPMIRDAVVLAQQDQNDQKRLVAYLVTKQTPTMTELRAFLSHTLPEYMIPAEFAILETLPLTPNGKVDYKALHRAIGNLLKPKTTYVPLQTQMERQIAALWQEVLAVERVGRHDNFFDLGGHSLLMMQVQTRLQRELERQIPIVHLFQFPTIGTLSEYLTGQSVSVASPGLNRGEMRRQLLDQRSQQRSL